MCSTFVCLLNICTQTTIKTTNSPTVTVKWRRNQQEPPSSLVQHQTQREEDKTKTVMVLTHQGRVLDKAEKPDVQICPQISGGASLSCYWNVSVGVCKLQQLMQHDWADLRSKSVDAQQIHTHHTDLQEQYVIHKLLLSLIISFPIPAFTKKLHLI